MKKTDKKALKRLADSYAREKIPEQEYRIAVRNAKRKLARILADGDDPIKRTTPYLALLVAEAYDAIKLERYTVELAKETARTTNRASQAT